MESTDRGGALDCFGDEGTRRSTDDMRCLKLNRPVPSVFVPARIVDPVAIVFWFDVYSELVNAETQEPKIKCQYMTSTNFPVEIHRFYFDILNIIGLFSVMACG